MEQKQEQQKQLETRNGRASLPALTPEEIETIKLRIKYFGVGAIPTTLVLTAMSGGQFLESAAIGVALGTAGWYFANGIHGYIAYPLNAAKQILGIGRKHEDQADDYEDEDEDDGQEEPTTEALEKDALFASADDENDTGGVERLTIERIVKNTEHNSYTVWIGRSLTKTDNPAVQIGFYGQHIKFMGGTQKGKSSMLGAFLDIVTQTHDTKHIRLVLLDQEDKTSKLFAHLPHILPMRKADGQIAKLHARNSDQVLEYLIHTVNIMLHRLKMSTTQVEELPVILIYIEEFLRLKDELRVRIVNAVGETAKAKARSDFETFCYCIKAIAQQGLKVRMQLLLCAQVEYADDSFNEALAMVQSGFAFCLDPDAAGAGGFLNRRLLKQNAQSKKRGQAVVETPDCNDLILAPDYDLKKRILEFEKAHPEIYAPVNAEMDIYEPVNMSVNGATSDVVDASQKSHLRLLATDVNDVSEHEDPKESPVNVIVTDEVKQVIKRLNAQGVLKHNQIAKVVMLDGRKYPTYQQVCRELGIAIEA